jgi:hypothetical protein
MALWYLSLARNFDYRIWAKRLDIITSDGSREGAKNVQAPGEDEVLQHISCICS